MTEPEPGTLPTGPLLWGQAGVYDAIDDRLAVTALATGITGLVRPPELTPGAGLSVNVGRWHGITDCGDGTLAVVGTRDTQPVEVPAGGGALRTDVLFAEVDPDAGTWTADLFSEAETAGLLGVRLGTIGVPAGANGSAQFDLRPGSVALARVRSAFLAQAVTVTSAVQSLLPFSLPIQAGHRYMFDMKCHLTGLSTGSAFLIPGGLPAASIAAGYTAALTFIGQGAANAWPVIRQHTPWSVNTGYGSGALQNNLGFYWTCHGQLTCLADGNLSIGVAATGNWRAEIGTAIFLYDVTAAGPAAVAAPARPGPPGRIIR